MDLTRYQSISGRHRDGPGSKGRSEAGSPKNAEDIPATVHEAVRRNVAFNANTVSGSDGRNMAAQLRVERDKVSDMLQKTSTLGECTVCAVPTATRYPSPQNIPRATVVS